MFASNLHFLWPLIPYDEVPLKSKWVWSENTTITHCSQIHGTVRKNDRTIAITIHLTIPWWKASGRDCHWKSRDLYTGKYREISIDLYRCVSDCRSRVREFDPTRSHTFTDINYEIISTITLLSSASLFKKVLSVTSESTGYINRLFKLVQEKKVWLGELTVPTT